MRRLMRFATSLTIALSCSTAASAQGVDLTLFLGAAFPTFDQSLTLHPPIPSVPGFDVSLTGTPEIRLDGGVVYGGALAFEAGILGIEGRLDATEVGFDLTGARYDLRSQTPPLQGLRGSIRVADGRIDTDRLYLLSINARIRTPGAISFVASGGLSYLPEFNISGSVPLSLSLNGLSTPGFEPRLRLRASQGDLDKRFGVNGGAGLRFGAGRVAVMGEVRVFYFRDFELRFDVDDAPDLVAALVDRIEPIEFQPIFVNAQAGLVIKF